MNAKCNLVLTFEMYSQSKELNKEVSVHMKSVQYLLRRRRTHGYANWWMAVSLTDQLADATSTSCCLLLCVV